MDFVLKREIRAYSEQLASMCQARGYHNPDNYDVKISNTACPFK